MSQGTEKSDDSDASTAKAWIKSSRDQLLEDLAVKDRDLRSCTKQQQRKAQPWWMRAILWLATIFLLVVAIWGIVALVYIHRLSNGVAAARHELATLNAKIARRLQLLDDTQRLVSQLREVGQNPQHTSHVALRLAQLQQVFDQYVAEPTVISKGEEGGKNIAATTASRTGNDVERGVAVPLPQYQYQRPASQPPLRQQQQQQQEQQNYRQEYYQYMQQQQQQQPQQQYQQQLPYYQSYSHQRGSSGDVQETGTPINISG